MLTQIILISLMAAMFASEYLIYGRNHKGETPKLSRREVLIAALFFFVLMIGFAGATGILSSGYHLVDDHETLGIENNIASYGFWGAMYRRLQADLTGRFRPTYCIVRVIQTALFNHNFTAWHIMYAVISAFVSFMSYIYARIRSTPIWMAYVVSIAVYIGGGQSSVMWRLGPQEGIGLIFLATTVFGMLWYRQKRSLVRLIALTVSTILLSGSKESFLVLIPFLPILFVIWDLDTPENTGWSDIRIVIKKYLAYFIISWFIFVADMLYIFLYVNTRHIDQEYMGEAAESFGIMDYAKGIGASMLRGFLPYFIFFILGNIVIIMILYRHRKDENKTFMIRHLTALILTDILMMSQIALYAKIRMRERYIIPASLFAAALWFIEVCRLIREDESSEMMKRIYTAAGILFAISLFAARYDTYYVQYIYPGRSDQAMAADYAIDGHQTEDFLSKTAELASDDSVIIADLGVENDSSVAIYLQNYYGISDVYGINLYPSVDDMPVDISVADIYIGYPDHMIQLLEKNGISTSTMERYDYGPYTVLTER